MFSISRVRKDFPILNQKVNGHPLVYLDNAATSQKPTTVTRAIKNYYEQYNANIHRGIHALSEKATEAYEHTKDMTARFIHAKNREEIIFVRGATDGLNTAARLLSDNVMKKGDTILLSLSEHHSNIVPWQILAKRHGYRIKYIPIDSEGCFDMPAFERLLRAGVKVLAVQHVSNVTGVIHPIEKMVREAKQYGCYTVIDACQSAPHFPLDVQKIGCDFLSFSAHKMLGPTGFGVLYGKKTLLEQCEPVFGGGDMISEVHKEYSTWNVLPYKFEPGTPHIAGAVGFYKAMEYIQQVGWQHIQAHEHDLAQYALHKLQEISNVTIVGPKTTKSKIGVIPFTLKNIHPHDIAQVLDQFGVAVRVGHHCAQLLHKELRLQATARISLYLYNTKKEVDMLVKGLHSVIKMFA